MFDSDTLFLIIILLAPPLNILAWWLLKHPRGSASPVVPWRERVGRIGLWANSLAIAIPFGAFTYGFIGMEYLSLPSLPSLPFERPDTVPLICLTLVAISIICGVIGPARIRVPMVCSASFAGSFWFLIRAGVL